MLRANGGKVTVKQWMLDGKNVRFMEVHNGLSALVACAARDARTQAQFDGLWVSSLTCTAAAGLPDLEMSIVDNRLNVISGIVQTSWKPVIVDGDTGGDTSALRYFCRALERLGVAGIIVEEKAMPKRNSLDETPQALADPIEFSAKLTASREALEGSDFMIVARLESLTSGLGMDEAIYRARMYANAGVDGILIHSRSDSDREVMEFASRFRRESNGIPLFCVPTTYHTATATDLFAGGIQGVIYANHQLRAAHAAMWNACLSILQHDRSSEIEKRLSPTKRVLDEVGYSAEVARIVEIENETKIAKTRRDAPSQGIFNAQY